MTEGELNSLTGLVNLDDLDEQRETVGDLYFHHLADVSIFTFFVLMNHKNDLSCN